MKKPFVISIAAQSDGGKTTIVTASKELLAYSDVIYWDDYGDEVRLWAFYETVFDVKAEGDEIHSGISMDGLTRKC